MTDRDVDSSAPTQLEARPRDRGDDRPEAAMAETLAELAASGVAFSGVTERPFEGGAISSTVRPLGAWEAEVIAVGRHDDWQAVVTARVWVNDGARVLWWQRTQGPFAPPQQEP